MLPVICIGWAPSDSVFCCASDERPTHLRIRTHSAINLRLRWRRSAGDGGERGDVQFCHPGEIGEVHLVDGVAIFDALFGAQVLVLPVIILDRDADPRGGISKLQERNMVAAAPETVGAPDLPDVEADRRNAIRQAIEEPRNVTRRRVILPAQAVRPSGRKSEARDAPSCRRESGRSARPPAARRRG